MLPVLKQCCNERYLLLQMLPVLKQCCKELVENVQEKAARNEEVDARLLVVFLFFHLHNCDEFDCNVHY